MKIFSLQEIINFIYRHPKGRISKINRFGGFVSYKRMLLAHEAMKLKSLDLPPVQSFEEGLPLYFLTGRGFLYQTLFCITSLSKHTKQKFLYHLVDDGSLDINLAKEKLPGSIIITSAEIERNLKRALPELVYPIIRQKRSVYPHLKKLTDIHTIQGSDRKLVLDSDMLFWREPVQLIEWLKKPSGNLFMTDSNLSYGYTKDLMQQLCGAPIPDLLNVGIAGIQSDIIDWQSIEKWITILEAQEGGSYFLEQALTAMIAANSSFTLLPSNQYIVYPSRKQVATQQGILHHYVDLSKKDYFLDAWQKFI